MERGERAGTVTFGDAGSLTSTAAFSAAGSYTLRLTANDGALSGTDEVVVTVSAANQAPVANAGVDASVSLPNTLTLAGSVSDDGLPDPPGTVTVAWSEVSGPGTVTFGDAGSLTSTAAFSAAGSYTLRLTANDGALSGTDEVVVTVSAANQAPVANAGVDASVSLPNTLTLAGSVSDDGLPDPPGTVTVAWSEVSGPGTVTFGDAGSLTSTAAFSAAGSYTLRLTANDGALSGTDEVVVTVSAANQAPVANAGLDASVSLPNALTLAGSVSDDGLPHPPGTVTVAWSEVSGPGTVTFGDAGSLTSTAAFSAAGSYTLRLTANDGALSGTDEVVVTVSAANQAPVANAGLDASVSLPNALTLAGSVSDDGLPHPPGTVTVAWSEVSGPGTVTFGDAGSLTSTAAFSAAGSYTLRLTANDGALSGTDEVVVTVSAANQAPVANAGLDASVSLPNALTLAGSVSDDGLPQPPGTVTVAWSEVSGPGTVTFGDAGSLTSTAAFSAAGSYTLRLTANDGALSGTDEVVVTVSAANQAPVANAGLDASVSLPNALTLAGSVSDDGLPQPPGTVTVAWSEVSGPGTVTFGDAGSLTSTAAFSAAGSYTLRLTANDGALSGTDEVVVTVSAANQAPVANAGLDASVSLPNALTLAGSVSDDGLPQPPGTVTVAWSKVSGPGTVTFGDAGSLTSTAAFSAAGSYTLRLTANDGALSGTDEVVVTVSAANQAPVANAGLDASVSLPNALTLAGSVSDDGLPQPPGTVTVAWSKVSGPGTVTFGDAGSLTSTAAFSAAGSYTLRLTANDGALSGTDEVVVTVSAANQAPVANAGLDASVSLPNALTLAGSVSDDGLPQPPGTVTVAWSKVSGPGTVTFGDAGSLTSTAAFSAAGSYTLRLTANDGALSGTDEVVVTVSAANQAPVANAGLDASVSLPNALTLAGSVSDDGLPQPPGTVTVAWSKVSGPGTVTFGDAGSLTSTAAFSAAGSYTLRLTANDGALSGTDEVVVTVSAANQAPVANAGLDASVSLPNALTLAGSVSDDGLPQPPGTVTVAWSKVSGPGTVTFGDAGSLTSTAAFSAAGSYTLRLTANDGALSGTDEVVVTVSAANQAPVANAGLDASVSLPNALTLAGSVSDDGLPQPPGTVTVAWSKVSGPGTVTFGDAGSLTSTAAFSAAGSYTLRLTANDGALSGTDEVVVTVSAANQAPVANAGLDASVSLPNALTLAGSVSDDGLPQPPGTVTVAWSKVSGPGTVTFGDAGSLTSTAAFSAAGSYTLRLTANDGALSGTDEVVVTVSAANQAPVANAGLDASVSLPNALTLAGSVSDDGLPQPPGTVTVAWSKVSGPGTVTFGDAGSLTSTAAFSAAGSYTLRLTANDGALSGTDEVVVTVSAANQAPVANAGLDASVSLPNALTLAGSVSDDGLPQPPGTVTVAWSKVSGPGTVTFGDAGSLTSTAAFSAAGSYTLRLTANDGALSGTDEVVVTVSAANQAPVANAGLDASVSLPNALTLAGSVSDDGLPQPPGTVTVAWSEVSGPGTVTFGDAGSLTSTAAFSAAGSYTLRLTANDGALSGTDEVVVTVSAANQAPVANAGVDASVSLPNTLTLARLASDDGLPDPPGTVTVAWSEASKPRRTFGDAGSLTSTAAFSAAGSYTLRLTANDGALSGTDEVVVTVSAANQAPVANAGLDASVSLPNALTLAGSVSDDGLPDPPGTVTVAWSKVSGPGR